ncbi:MAG TPA: tetratricopeptide repeat protein [Dehalococcoidia bacterium]|nr:tetratricopeptide repeat protein [Dehalococcoidia bacterium]HIN24739.1 tetratricopeptide repeat protein [Dehalococcoidia bacterium]
MSTQGSTDFRTLFSKEVKKPEADIRLDRAALYLAGEEYPEIDVHSYLAELDAFASQIALREIAETAPADLARAIAHYLFDQVGLHGNTGEYYSPENSYLNRVLETRTGIPITLSLIFLEVARRLGLRCSGVGLPGHFIVGLDDTGEYLDPFNAGTMLSAEDCRNLVQNMSGGRLEWTDQVLAPYTKRDVLFRILNNLKNVYMQTKEYTKAVGVIQRMAIISPSMPSLYQEQAWCHAQQYEYRMAIGVLEAYLEEAGEPDDSKQVKDQITGLWASLSRLN